MRTYIEAYDKDGKQVLGNLDGQASIRAKDYKRTHAYIRLKRGLIIPGKRITFWQVVDEKGRILERISNPHLK